MTHSRKWSWLKAWGMKIARHRGMKRAIVAVAATAGGHHASHVGG
jgi:transposase